MEILLNTLKWSLAVGGAALVLTLLKPLLDRRYSAKWRYGVWLALAALLLLAPVPWSLPETAPPVIIQAPPRMEVSVSRRDGLSLEVRRPAGTPRPVEASAGEASAVLPLETILTALWLSGGGLFLLYHLAGTWRFTRRARRWSRPAGEEAQGVYEAVRREMGLEKAPPLSVSAMVETPMAVGLLRPRLLLPEQDFQARELAFILRHELTHIRRRDLWYKLVLLAANALHWFNPLIWLLRREAERDLELTCDDAVVAGADRETRRAYSEALMASIRPQRERSVLSTHFYGGKAVMKERFWNILGRRGRRWGAAVLAAALLATVGAACAFGVRSSGALSAQELAEFQARVDSPEMGPYLSRMYTDPALLPPEELLDGEAQTVRATVTGGTRDGDMVSLELEGAFPNGLTQGTLNLLKDEPVYFAAPIYVVVEGAARRLMNQTAEDYIQWSRESESITGTLEFPEKYITDLRCVESMEFDGKTYYVWTLQYRMKPNDMGNVLFAGGMDAENGWLTEQSSMGSPYFIFSLDEEGNIASEEQDWTTRDALGTEGGFTWEEYIYCRLHLGLGGLENGVWGGWPELNTPFLESLREGHETWATDWEDTALTYLSRRYGLTAEGGVTLQRTFEADEKVNSHTQAVLVRADCGNRKALLLLTEVAYPLEDATLYFWQVAGEKWTPDRPEAKPDEIVPPTDPMPAPTPNSPDTGTIPSPTPRPSTPEPAPMPQPDAPASGDQSGGGTAVPKNGDFDGDGVRDSDLQTPTGIIGDFDGDGAMDPEFLAHYTKVDDPASGNTFYLPKDPDEGYTPLVIDPPSGLPLVVTGSVPIGVPIAEGEGMPGVRTSTGAMGDFDGDGVRDEEVWINGVYHRVIFDWETNDISFDPPAPEHWETVTTTPPTN